MAQNINDDVELNEIKNYFSNVQNFYIQISNWLFKGFLSYWYILLIGVIGGGMFGYLQFQKKTPYFEVQASFTFNELHKKIYGEMTDKLQQLVSTHSNKTLSELLKLKEQEAMNILDIQALTVSGTPLSEDLSIGKLPFYIKVKLKDRNVAAPLLISLENYYNNNPQAKTIIENSTLQMKSRITYLNSELQKLDSLKRAYQFYLMQQPLNSNTTVNTFNPIELYKESEKLFNIKSDLESAITNFKAVKILDQFVVNDTPIQPILSKDLIKYMGIGLMFSAVLCLLLMVFKKR